MIPPDMREEWIIRQARQRSPAQRAAFLGAACGGDHALRQRLQSLLAGHDKPAPSPSSDAPAAKATLKLNLAEAESEAVGQTIGRYKLLEAIGEGGCGVVYVAEQTEPVRRRVALKVIKLGMDTKQVVARFEAERQALAMMDHPNIAKVLDAGTTDRGRPFFVMELVRGIRITDYCDQNKLTTKERLDLFIRVCQAIQHAHQKGIIHRDIKPSNILVTLHDGEAVPKVIDFGIAKATEGRLTENTVYTQLQQFIGTPAYMSPEQAEMSGLDIDTRSDIYSLGVLLYELLTGSTPFDSNELVASGLDEMRKTIREKEPVRPSTRFATLEGEKLTATAKRRSTEAGKLLHQLKGDLDWVVMKCLEKERTRRYETANGLAFDLKRHLNNETVLARPPGSAYRFQKLVRRNKLAFAAAAAIAAALLLGFLASTWEAVRAKCAEQRARESETAAQTEMILAKQAKRRAEDNLLKAQKAEKEATQERIRADGEAEVTQQNLYYSQMHVAQQSWREHRGLPHMRELLAKWLPQGGSPDRRGWEWFYLNSLAYQNVLILQEGERNFVEGTSSEKPSVVAWQVAGNRLAEGASDGSIRVWDVDRKQTTLILKGPAPVVTWPGGGVIGWSLDGGKLAGGGSDGTVHIWDAGSGRELNVLRVDNSPVQSVNFSSDGTRVAAWGTDGMVKIWDATTGQVTAEVAHPGHVTAGAWSPDDHLLAVGHEDGTVTLSGTHAGDKLVTLRGHARRIHRLAWSPDSARLASTSADHTARIWDVASEKVALDPLWHSHEITAVAWEPNGRRLATGSIDQTIKIWDAATGREVVTLRGHVQAVTSLSWGPDGRLASGCTDGSVRIWNSIRDQEANVLPAHIGRATATAWSPNGERLASGGDDGKVKIWDLVTRKEVLTLNAHDEGRVDQEFGLIRSLAWSPDGTLLASAALDGTAKVWELASGREVFALPADHGPVWSVAWSLDGDHLAAGSKDGSIRLVEGLKHTPKVQVFQAHESSIYGVRSVAWSPKGDRLASVGDGHLIKIWNPVLGAELVRIKLSGTARAVAWSPGGKLLASASSASGSRLVMAWDAETGQMLSTMRGHNDNVDAVVWSPDGTRLASASLDSSVRVWDPRTGEETLVLRGNVGSFYDVSWNPDGARLAAACSDGQIWIWDAARGFERETRPAPFSLRPQAER
jgi:WD40 repeat protein